MDKWVEGLTDLLDDEKRAQMRSDMAAVLDVCRKGDETGLAEIRAREDEDGWQERLLLERNRAWLPHEGGSSGSCWFLLPAGSSYECSGEGTIHVIGANTAPLRSKLLDAARSAAIPGCVTHAPSAIAGELFEAIPRNAVLKL